ncbi:MAG: hypothetical protein ACOVRN_01845 [Flavobacterium sp.]
MSESVPEEFVKVMRDFVNDIKTTFPEYVSFIDKWWKTPEHFAYIEEAEDREVAFKKAETKAVKLLFDHCKKKFPPRFFDILYQNADMFKEESDLDTEFFPKIHFKNLWQCEISDKTRETIWKYLQLILFSIVGALDNKESFGDTAKLFEAINGDEFKQKLEETMSQMNGLFDASGVNLGEGVDMPNAEQLNDHLTGMLDGKIGQLAKEIAEDAASSLEMEFEDATDMKDVFSQLIKHPTKLMGLLKTVGDKLDSKLKSGELKESEMIQEATDIMNKMKTMPGMGNFQSMLSKMGMNLGGGGGKVNTAAMEAKLNQRLKLAKTKERIRAKAEANAMAKAAAQALQQSQQQPSMTIEETLSYLNDGEKPEKTPRSANPNNKKKKGKK